MAALQLTSGHIHLQVEAGVALVTLDRADTKNALSLAMYADLVAVLAYCQQAPEVRVVAITGANGQFTSGNDLKDFLKNAGLDGADSPIRAFILAVLQFPKPLLAAVEGVAYGIGTTLLMHCDYVVAHPKASFCLPFVKLGLVPEFGASQLLEKLVGLARARQWLLGGEPFSAQEAAHGGLLHAESQEPLAALMVRAKEWALLPPEAVRATKRLLIEHARGELTKVVEDEITAFTKALASPEFKEAASAFFEKRPARF